jgi:hypothetical protein
MMTLRFIVIALVLGLAAAGQAQTKGPAGQSALVYSGSASFWVDAPGGWVLDSEAGRRDGPIVVLYRQGKTWKTSEPVMYANVSLPKGKTAVVTDAMKADEEQWRTQVVDLVVTNGENVTTSGGQTAEIRKFQSAAARHYESVAYILGPQRVWLLVLSARSSNDHNAAYPDFLKWIRSYAPGPTVKSP